MHGRPQWLTVQRRFKNLNPLRVCRREVVLFAGIVQDLIELRRRIHPGKRRPRNHEFPRPADQRDLPQSFHPEIRSGIGRRALFFVGPDGGKITFENVSVGEAPSGAFDCPC